MALAEQSERGNRYCFRPQRALPGSFRDYLGSDNDDEFAANFGSVVACDTNGRLANQEGDDGGWFNVEAIKRHRVASDESIEYRVKWENSDELTWEPEENLRSSVPKIVMQYHRSIRRHKDSIRRKRQQRGTAPRRRALTNPRKKANLKEAAVDQTAELYSLLGSWKSEVRSIDGIDREEDTLIVHVTWLNGEKMRLFVCGDEWDQKYGEIQRLSAAVLGRR